MEVLHDYVRWISDSMNKELNEDDIHEITDWLANSDKYRDMVKDLESVMLNYNSQNKQYDDLPSSMVDTRINKKYDFDLASETFREDDDRD